MADTPVQTRVAGTLIDVFLTKITCIPRWADTPITINQVLKGRGKKKRKTLYIPKVHNRPKYDDKNSTESWVQILLSAHISLSSHLPHLHFKGVVVGNLLFMSRARHCKDEQSAPF